MKTHTAIVRAALRTLRPQSLADLLDVHVSHVYNANAGRGVSDPLRAALVRSGLAPARRRRRLHTRVLRFDTAEAAATYDRHAAGRTQRQMAAAALAWLEQQASLA